MHEQSTESLTQQRSDPMTLRQSCRTTRGTIRFHVAGQGEPVLLIMGFMARGRSWRDQVEALSQHHQVVWFDHIGVGDSEGEPARSMREFSEDCEALLETLGWTHAHVIGISMGGMIAQEFALRNPSKVLSLTLIVTHFGGLSKALPPLRGLPYFLRAQFARTQEKRLTALKQLLVPAQALANISPEEIESRLREDFTPKPKVRVRLSHILAVLRHNTKRRLDQIKVKTLVVQAQSDLLVNPKHSEALASQLPNAQLLSFADAGHGIIRQRNIPLAEAVLQHLSAASST